MYGFTIFLTIIKAYLYAENYAFEVDQWIEEDKVFFETSAAKKILKTVQENPFVVITGSPGGGKTSAAIHAALY